VLSRFDIGCRKLQLIALKAAQTAENIAEPQIATTLSIDIPPSIPYIFQSSIKMAVLEPYKDTDYYLWKYIPSLVASIVFLTLYLIMACLIGFRLYKTKTWFCSAFVIGCWCKLSRSS
jgi:hypothetical protein